MTFSFDLFTPAEAMDWAKEETSSLLAIQFDDAAGEQLEAQEAPLTMA